LIDRFGVSWLLSWCDWWCRGRV